MRIALTATALALAGALAAAGDAAAYTIDSVLTTGCHERITMDALRRARRDTPAAHPLAPVTRDERALVRDLPFEVDGDMQDLGAAALALGTRNLDLHGGDPADLAELPQLHAANESQADHCLRGRNHDEPGGNALALDACRAFILSEVAAALEGLSDEGAVLPENKERVSVTLAIRGRVEVDLPRFYYRVGMAFHALQDAFAHHYRTADHLRVVAVANYVDPVEGTHEPARDGPAHSAQLDRCDGDEFRRARRGVATTASTELLKALLDPALSHAEREGRAERVLERYMSLEPGCTHANAWCDAPEAKYAEQACGCSTPGGGGNPRSLGLLALIAVLGAMFRRRRTIGVLACVGALGAARTAAAAEPARERPARTADRTAAPGSRVGVEIAGGFAPKRPAFAGSIGARYRLADHLLAGVDVEHNPWFSGTTREVRLGVLNAYTTGVLRFPLRQERINVRTTLSLGASRMLFDLVGVPKGSTGVFVGVIPLGLDVRLSRAVLLVLNPGHIAVPAPHLVGVPFAYVQYRFTVGVQLGGL